MAAPSYRNKGTFTIGTGAISVPVPATYSAGDILILLVNTANEAVATPDGWTQVDNSPQGTGTAGSAGGVRLYAFWKVSAASESAVAIADAGNYTAGQMFSFYNANATTPINVTAGSVQATGATSWTLPAVVTTSPDCLILLCIGNDRDATQTDTLLTWWINYGFDTDSMADIVDQTGNSGVGGGLGVCLATKSTAGNTGTTSVSSATAVTAAFLTIALAPVGGATYEAGVTESAAASDSPNGSLPVLADAEESLAAGDTPDARIAYVVNQGETGEIADAPDGRIPYMPTDGVDEVSTIEDIVRTSTPPAQSGTAYLSSFSGPQSSVSFSVTVPAGTTLVVGVMLVFDYSYMGPISSIPMPTMGGEPFVQEGILNEWGQTCFIVQHDPLIGAQTFAWNSGDADEKVDHICLMFYTGTGENPIVSTLHSSGTISADPAILSGYAYDPIGLTVGVAVLSYDTQLTGETYTDDYQSLIGSFSPNGIDAGMVVFDKTINTHRVYTTNTTRNAMSLMAINLQGRLDGGDVVIAAQDESSTPAAISDGEAPNAHQDEAINILALEGPYATINRTTPLVITPETQVNFGYTINIPAGTEVIVLFCTAYSPYAFSDWATPTPTTRTFFYLNGEPFTQRIATYYETTNLAAVAAYVFVNPPPGEQTLSWDCYMENTSTYSMFVLNFLKNIDIITDPVVSVARNDFGFTYDTYIPPDDLTHSPGDILIGMICSDVEFADTADHPPMSAYPPPPSPLVQYDKVAQGGSGSWGGWHGVVGISMGPETDFGILRQAGQRPPVAVALCLRCKNAPEWIDTLLNDVSVPETAVVADYPQVYELYDADVENTLLPVVIDGSYVDIPTGVVNAPRTGCYAYLIKNNPSSVGITIEPGVNLFVAIFSSHWSNADTWLGPGDYTLTLNGVVATHYTMLDSFDRAITVAYVKNPTSGVLAIGINNPHYGNEIDERDSDLFVAFQVKHANVSGDPIRGLSGTTAGYLNDITVSGIDYVLGDMVVGVLSTNDYYSTPEIEPYLKLALASDYFYDTVPPYTDWEQALSIGCTRIGGGSSILLNNINQADLYVFALVIKCGGDIIGDTLNDDAGASLAAEETVAGSLAFDGAFEVSLAVEEATPATLAFLGDASDSTAVTESLAGESATSRSRADSLAVSVVVGTDVPETADVADSAAVDESMSSTREASGMGYAWAISRATQNGWKVADDLWSDTLAVEGATTAGQGTPADMADTLTVADVVTAYVEAGALMAELMSIAEASDVTQVLGGNISEIMQVVAQATTTAEMYAAVIESVILLDQWLAEALRREIKKFMASGRVTSFLHRLVDLSQFMVDKKMLEFDCVPAAREVLEQERFTDYAPDQPRSEVFTTPKVQVEFQCPKNVQFTAELVPVIFYCAEVKASGETPTKKDFEV